MIYPALTRLRDFLQNDYLGHAREGVGLIYMKGGDALYRYEVAVDDDAPMTPEQIHQLGLSEVARITKEFEKVRQEVGFKGDLHAFFDYMRTSPKFAPKSREQLESRLRADQVGGRSQGAAVFLARAQDAARDPALSAVPREVRGGRLAMTAARRTARGPAPSISTPTTCRHASPGKRRPCSSTRASRATISRSAWRRRTRRCRAFMRFGGNTAYVEGWALYSETLGYDMGFYKDPYSASER